MKQNQILFSILALIVCIVSIIVIGYGAIVSHRVQEDLTEQENITEQMDVAITEQILSDDMSFEERVDVCEKRDIEVVEAVHSAEDIMGADMVLLDYADEEIIIFHCYKGLFVYHRTDGSLDGVDLENIGCNFTQGDQACEVGTSVDGMKVYLHTMNAEDMYIYATDTKKMQAVNYAEVGGVPSEAKIKTTTDCVDLESDVWHSEYCALIDVEGETVYGYLTCEGGLLKDLVYVEGEERIYLFGEENEVKAELPKAYDIILNNIYDALQLDPITNEIDNVHYSTGIHEAVLSGETAEDRMKAIAYCIMDVNEDGVEELLIVDTVYPEPGNVRILDMYTLVEGTSVKVIEGWSRNRYSLLDDGMIYCSGSGGTASSFEELLSFDAGTYKLTPKELYFIYPKNDDMSNCGFCYSADGIYDVSVAIEISEEEYQSFRRDCEGRMVTIKARTFDLFK